jgi:hypothetical protein
VRVKPRGGFKCPSDTTKEQVRRAEHRSVAEPGECVIRQLLLVFCASVRECRLTDLRRAQLVRVRAV